MSEDNLPLREQLLVLFASCGLFPDEYRLAGYERGLQSLQMGEDEAYLVFQHFIEHARANPKDDAPAPAEIRTYAYARRDQQAVAAAPHARERCAKCRGTGFKMVNETGMDVEWNHYPRRAVKCDCKKVVHAP